MYERGESFHEIRNVMLLSSCSVCLFSMTLEPWVKPMLLTDNIDDPGIRLITYFYDYWYLGFTLSGGEGA